MIRILAFACLLLATLTGAAQHTQSYWAADVVAQDIYNMACTPNEAVYFAGFTDGNLNVDANGWHLVPGPGRYVAKYDAAGNFDWEIHQSGNNGGAYNYVATDGAGDLYVAGSFAGTTDLDGTAGTDLVTTLYPSVAAGFVAHYTSAGAYVQSMEFQGNHNVEVFGVELDMWGNMYVLGAAWDTVDLDPGPGVANMIVTGGRDTWVSAYSPAGSLMWWQQIATDTANFGGWTIPHNLHVSDLGHVIVSGAYAGTLTLDPNGQAQTTTAPQNSYGANFIATYSSNGVYIWGGGIHGSPSAHITDLESDLYGNAYVSLFYADTVDIDVAAATSLQITSSVGYNKALLIKYDQLGTVLWSGELQSSEASYIGNIAVDDYGTIHAAGNFQQDIYLDFQDTSAYYQSDGIASLVYMQYDSSGALLWHQAFDTTAAMHIRELELSPFGNLYAFGKMNGTMDFDPGPGTQVVGPTGIEVTWLHKWRPCQALNIATTGNSVCLGDSVALTASGYPVIGWNNGYTNGSYLTPTAPVTLNVGASDLAGCTLDSNISITIENPPTLTATASADTVCQGDSVTFNANTTAAVTWLGGPTDGVPYPMTSSGHYVASASAGVCMGVLDSVYVEVGNVNIAAIASSDSLCAGESATLSGSGTDTYTWSNGIADGALITPTSTATYFVTGTDATNGCTDDASVTIVVSALPVLAVSVTNATVCAGEPTTITAAGNDSYIWSGGVQNGAAFTPAATNTYSVTATNTAGCDHDSSLTITVNPVPTITITSAADSICLGENATLSAAGADQITWSNGVLNGTPFPVTSDQTYLVTGTNVTGCMAQDSITLFSVSANITAVATATSICPGETVTLVGFGGQSYTWTNGATDAVPFAPPTSNTYTVTGIDANGCTDTDAITVIVHTLPGVAFGAFNPDSVCLRDTLLPLPAAAPAGGTYSGPGVLGDFVALDNAGLGTHAIVYSIISTDGCLSTDTSFLKVISCPPVGIEASMAATNLSVYPIPATTLLSVEWPTEIAGAATLRLTSLSGATVAQWSVSAGNAMTQLDVADVANGMYLLAITSNGTIAHKRVVIAH